MRRCFQQIRRELVEGWLLALLGTVVYLLTLEPTTSFWDCGEFIAISLYLQVGHPPGAPFYQLLAHCFSWFAGGDMMAVAKCCNALSAVAGGFTVMFLYWSILLIFNHKQPSENKTIPAKIRFSAIVGALCYLFCDTAWFSAVESEVYSLATLIASVIVWAMLRWYRSDNPRWLMLTALLLGLGVCTHLLTLLTTPVLLLLFIFKWRESKSENCPQSNHQSPVTSHQSLVTSHQSPVTLHTSLFIILFFLIGLTPYLIIPIRAAADTPINEGHPATVKEFKSYFSRDRYEKAPLYPRMWRHHKNDALYASDWCRGDTSFVGNAMYYGSYQLSYMYLRYLMWNFSGRYNDRQGYGSPMNGQLITGIPPIDRLIVGTGKTPPPSLPTKGRNVYFLLPFILGILGMVELASDKKKFWTVMTLFLMGGIILNLYLNHPCYEPRERDYAYILSFYAFCIFIAAGAKSILKRDFKKPIVKCLLYAVLFAVPLWMALQNWDDHDRSGRYIARDAAANILNSCSRDPQGAVLFTYGDNDTFPLWYIQTVEKERLDVRVENIGLMGWGNFTKLLDESMQQGRPVYFSHYAYNQYHHLFADHLQLEGNTYRLVEEPCDSVAVEPFFQHLMGDMGWHNLEGVYVDEVGCKFLEQHWRDVVLLAENLADLHWPQKACAALDKTITEIPLENIQDVTLVHRIAEAYRKAGNDDAARYVGDYLQRVLKEQLAYYHSMPKGRQRLMPYTITPREELLTVSQQY